MVDDPDEDKFDFDLRQRDDLLPDEDEFFVGTIDETETEPVGQTYSTEELEEFVSLAMEEACRNGPPQSDTPSRTWMEVYRPVPFAWSACCHSSGMHGRRGGAVSFNEPSQPTSSKTRSMGQGWET